MVAYDFELSCKACRELAYSDVDSRPQHIARGYAIMHDGTKYMAVSSNPEKLRGINVDQIILVDDFRWYVYNDEREILRELRGRILSSCVPDDLLIQEYEW